MTKELRYICWWLYSRRYELYNNVGSVLMQRLLIHLRPSYPLNHEDWNSSNHSKIVLRTKIATWEYTGPGQKSGAELLWLCCIARSCARRTSWRYQIDKFGARNSFGRRRRSSSDVCQWESKWCGDGWGPHRKEKQDSKLHEPSQCTITYWVEHGRNILKIVWGYKTYVSTFDISYVSFLDTLLLFLP